MFQANDKWTIRIPIVAFSWALALTFVLLIGWFRNINLLVLLGYLMAAVLFLNAWAATRLLRTLRAQRRITQPIYAGLPFAVAVQITPTRGVRVGVRIDDAGPGHRLSWFIDRLEREGRALRGQVILVQRGSYRWGPVYASSGYPFGLVYRRKELAPAEEVIVLPRMGRLHHNLFRRFLSSASAAADCTWRQPRRSPSAQEHFHGLRPFRTGDNPRAVHWRTSARRGEWMVREFEDRPSENLLLVFDPAVSAESKDKFEAAVSLAATIAAEWRDDRGGRLVVMVGGENPAVLDAPSGPAHTRRVLEQLAVVAPSASSAAPGVFLEKLKKMPSAAVIAVAAGQSPLADLLRLKLRRPVVVLEATALKDNNFYESPSE